MEQGKRAAHPRNICIHGGVHTLFFLRYALVVETGNSVFPISRRQCEPGT
jgi:hypothetical protein